MYLISHSTIAYIIYSFVCVYNDKIIYEFFELQLLIYAYTVYIYYTLIIIRCIYSLLYYKSIIKVGTHNRNVRV